MHMLVRVPKLINWEVAVSGRYYAAQVPAGANIIVNPDTSVPAMQGNEHEFTIFVFRNTPIEVIKEFAKDLATRSIGYTYYISEIQSAFVAPAAPVQELAASEKGLLPV